MNIVEIQTGHLRLISTREKIIIPPCDGTETIAQASDVFYEIDPYFKKWGCDVKGALTLEAPAEVYEMVGAGSFCDDIFSRVSQNLYSFCFTQHQIKMFCKEHRDLLRRDVVDWTSFLFNVCNNFFLASVCCGSAGLYVGLDRLKRESGWSATMHRSRVVLPKLQSQNPSIS